MRSYNVSHLLSTVPASEGDGRSGSASSSDNPVHEVLAIVEEEGEARCYQADAECEVMYAMAEDDEGAVADQHEDAARL